MELNSWAEERNKKKEQKRRTVHIPMVTSTEAVLPSHRPVPWDSEPSIGLYQSQIWLSLYEQLAVTAEVKATQARLESYLKSPSTGKLCLVCWALNKIPSSQEDKQLREGGAHSGSRTSLRKMCTKNLPMNGCLAAWLICFYSCLPHYTYFICLKIVPKQLDGKKTKKEAWDQGWWTSVNVWTLKGIFWKVFSPMGLLHTLGSVRPMALHRLVQGVPFTWTASVTACFAA